MPLQRRAGGNPQRWSILSWFKYIDIPLFLAAMLVKLLLFNDYIAVRYMDTTSEDVWIAFGTLLLIMFWTVLLPARGRIIALLAINLALTFILYADLIYFRYFQDLISIPVLLQAGQVDSLWDSIGALTSVQDWWLAVDLALIVPLSVLAVWQGVASKRPYSLQGSAKLVQRQWRRRLATRAIASIVILAMGLGFYFVPVNAAKNSWAKGLFAGNWWSLSLYNVTGLYGFHGYDLFRYAQDHWFTSKTLPEAQLAEVQELLEARAATRGGLEGDLFFGRYAGSNVIMVQAEALHNFMLGRTLDGQEITPHMNKLLETSLYFEQFYHQTSQGRTSDADFTAHCSLQPLPGSSVFIRFAQNAFSCLPNLLTEAGYSASVYHAYDGGFWNRNVMYNRMGYDNFFNKKDFVIDEPVGWSLGDDSFFRQSAALMAEQPQPSYSFLITLSSHHPYRLPAAYQKLDLGEFAGTIFGDYLQAVHYLDQSLGNFIADLEEAGLWDTSILLLYGDHDNSIRDMEPFSRFLDKDLTPMDELNLLKQVPLIVHLPDEAKAGLMSQPSGQLDLAPTIMHLLGISSTDAAFLGTPLVTNQPPVAGKSIVFRNGSFTDGTVSFIASPDGIFENSACWEVATNTPTALSACEAGATAAKQELSMSDRIINNDLLKKIGQWRIN